MGAKDDSFLFSPPDVSVFFVVGGSKHLLWNGNVGRTFTLYIIKALISGNPLTERFKPG